MLKCALALLVVAAAIDATQAASHVAAQTACDKVCEDAYTAAGGDGRERRAAHAAVRTTCLATCQTDFDIADAKGKCDEVCQAAFDAVRSRRAGHAFEQTLCNAKCTAAQDVSLAAQADGVCDAGCQATFDAAAAAATAAAGTAAAGTAAAGTAAAGTAAAGTGNRSRRAGHAAAQGTCDAGCATVHSKADKMACDNVCDAEFDKAESVAAAATAAAATLFCSTYTTTCGGHATASKFGGSDAGEMTASCETWYKAADAGTAADTQGATRGCYEYHLTKAQEQGDDAGVASAATHCPHAKGDSVCVAGRNRRAAHVAAQTACKATCTATFDAEEVATAAALALTQPVEMTDLEKISAYQTKMAEFVTAEDDAGLKAFIKSEAANKCTCADFADYDPTTDTATFCGTACFYQAAAEAASGSFASSAAAVVIAGLAAALY